MISKGGGGTPPKFCAVTVQPGWWMHTEAFKTNTDSSAVGQKGAHWEHLRHALRNSSSARLGVLLVVIFGSCISYLCFWMCLFATWDTRGGYSQAGLAPDEKTPTGRSKKKSRLVLVVVSFGFWDFVLPRSTLNTREHTHNDVAPFLVFDIGLFSVRRGTPLHGTTFLYVMAWGVVNAVVVRGPARGRIVTAVQLG